MRSKASHQYKRKEIKIDTKNKTIEKTWTARQKQRVMSLVKSDCSNYEKFYHECLLTDGFGCALETSLHLDCDYFIDCVLPIDKTLEAEILGNRNSLKKCVCCGKEFVPGSNRAKYCPVCAKEVHRKQKNESARKKYASNPDK